MLIGPCRVAASLVDDAKNGVGANELDGKRDRSLCRVADELLAIDRGDAPVGQLSAGCPAVYFGLVEIDAFFILAGGAGRGRAGSAGSGREAISRGVVGASRFRA